MDLTPIGAYTDEESWQLVSVHDKWANPLTGVSWGPQTFVVVLHFLPRHVAFHPSKTIQKPGLTFQPSALTAVACWLLVGCSTWWHSCKKDFCLAATLQKTQFTGYVLKSSALALRVMGICFSAGLLAADLTLCHVGEVLEIGKYCRIKKYILKKKKSLRVEREESQEGKYLGQRIRLLLYQSQQLLVLIFNTQESGGEGCWERVRFFKGTQFPVLFPVCIFWREYSVWCDVWSPRRTFIHPTSNYRKAWAGKYSVGRGWKGRWHQPLKPKSSIQHSCFSYQKCFILGQRGCSRHLEKTKKGSVLWYIYPNKGYREELCSKRGGSWHNLLDIRKKFFLMILLKHKKRIPESEVSVLGDDKYSVK